jgi:hypothetical protein
LVDLKGGTTGQVLAKQTNTDMDFQWVTQDDANAIQNAIVDAKGDLIAATANDTPARLAVGNNGDTLVADSAATTGLRWQGNFAAGKNKVINGDFRIWQRGTSFNLPNSFGYTYTADRFAAYSTSGANAVVSQQTFTPGTAPVAGYEGATFLRYYTANTSEGHILQHKIEDVRNFAGQTITISFWAKAASTLSFNGYSAVVQDFGSGGSGAVSTAAAPSGSITTSWQRFSVTVNVPSISGKTIGTGSFINIQIGAAGNNTLDVWGLQAEAGNVATAFQTATGTLQGELAACQRYYVRFNQSGSQDMDYGLGLFVSTTQYKQPISLPVEMRTRPTTLDASGLRVYDPVGLTNYTSASSINSTNSTTLVGVVIWNHATGAFTTGRSGYLNTDGGYVGFSAEL